MSGDGKVASSERKEQVKRREIMSGGNYDCDYSHKNSNNNLEDISIEELDLSIRSERCLLNAEIYSVQDIVEAIKAPDDFLKIRNLGRESAEEI